MQTKEKARHACGGRARLHTDVQFSIDRDRRPHPADTYDVPDYAGRKIEVAPLLRLIREQDAFRPCREPIAETCGPVHQRRKAIVLRRVVLHEHRCAPPPVSSGRDRQNHRLGPEDYSWMAYWSRQSPDDRSMRRVRVTFGTPIPTAGLPLAKQTTMALTRQLEAAIGELRLIATAERSDA
jgi:hypothetical protein